ncbi:MAG TPA: PAS domain S-box protein [Myxococcaceae bacterium]|nr:PAS domain S-box protein [Myxococcaceae bacterium]
METIPSTSWRSFRPAVWVPAIAVCVGLAIVFAVGVRSYLHTTALEQTERFVARSSETIESLGALLVALDDAVAYRRGFALGGDAAQIEAYRAAVIRLDQARARLRQLIGDDPEQEKRLAGLEPLLGARVLQLDESLRASRELGFDAEREAAATAEGNAQSDRIRQLVSKMVAEERRLLGERESAARRDSQSVKRTLVLGFGTSVAVLLFAFLQLRSQISRRSRTERTLADREQRGAITLNSIADGVIATDSAGRIAQMNPVAEHLTGWQLAEAAGRPFAEVVHLVDEKTHAPLPDPVLGVLSTRESVGLSHRAALVARDGTQRPIADTAAPIVDADGQVQGVVLVFRDTTATRASEARFRRLVEAAPDAIVITDIQGRIAVANDQVNALFGYSHDELDGQPIEVLIPDRFRQRHVGHRADYHSAPAVRPMGTGLSLFARRKDGSEFPVEISLSPLHAEEGNLVIAAVRDVSMRYELERFREEFLEFISHDLKNPLSIISLQARVLARQLSGRGLPEEAHAVDVIAQSAAFIDRLVRELLEMAYVESQRMELHLEPIALGPFLQTILDRTISSFDRLRVHLEAALPVTALIESQRIERVVVNFLQNALKYSPPGSPIAIRLGVQDGTAEVSVLDAGPGLSAEEASYVFDKYRRGTSASRKEGLGLGLYISRRIVEAHGGRIGVESTPGRGARFYFQVPLAKGQAAAASPPAAAGAPPTPRLQGLKVLLVDDEPNALAALTTLLREEGLVISGATSGEQALVMAGSDRPDVAVLDVQMPGMSGLALLERLREMHPGLQAVIMSGYMAHHAGIAEVRETTGAAYVGKPVDVDELMRTLDRLVARHDPRDAATDRSGR